VPHRCSREKEEKENVVEKKERKEKKNVKNKERSFFFFSFKHARIRHTILVILFDFY